MFVFRGFAVYVLAMAQDLMIVRQEIVPMRATMQLCMRGEGVVVTLLRCSDYV